MNNDFHNNSTYLDKILRCLFTKISIVNKTCLQNERIFFHVSHYASIVKVKVGTKPYVLNMYKSSS